MPKLVSPYQVSFVPGRNIHDNVIMVNEMVHSMRRKRGKKGFMAIKVDLEKAYDHISWNYMEQVLKEINCPESLIGIIMSCIKPAATNIVWNGNTLEEFCTSRGLRQGDPISPYLFVLGMEKLTHMILDRVREKKWKGLRAGRKGPFISHMMFADDLVLFAEASTSQIDMINQCLQEFGAMSGHKISGEKSYIYFSPNVNQYVKKQICARSGFKQVQELGRYLGANISFPKRRREKFQTIIERVRKRLNGWKASSLSLAGRMTLVRSVMNSMALYPMQHDRLPQGVIDEIERLQRNFIWGEKEGERKRHAVAWKQLCHTKKQGGAGIKSLGLMNDAFLMKLLWRMNTEPESLWVQVLNGKYGREEGQEDRLVAKSGDSKLWKEVVKLYEEYKLHRRIVREPEEIEQLIWNLDASGEFTIASTYKWLIRESSNQGRNKWKLIWKLQVPERVRVFMWLAVLKRLPTKSITSFWNGTDGMCEICKLEIEDHNHVLRDCPSAVLIWKNLVPKRNWNKFFSANWDYWINANLSGSCHIAEDRVWPEIFALGCWHLWKWRNAQVHNQEFEFPRNAAESIRKYHNYYRKRWRGDNLRALSDCVDLISWKPPQRGWCKLNVDGAWTMHSGAGCGGVIRGNEGEWLGGFSVKLSELISDAAEAGAIAEGLLLCWDLGFRFVEVESDAKQVVEVINQRRSTRGYQRQLRNITELLERDWCVRISHVYREANRVADSLAELSLKIPERKVVWKRPPTLVERFLIEDQEGRAFPRSVSV